MKYPIILAHGLFGYDKLFFWRMFRGVKSLYESKSIVVHQPEVHPAREIAYRAGELKQILDGLDKCHIIAHSMGGLDSRYLLSPHGLDQGHKVLSLTTLSTPHRGSPMAPAIPETLKTCVSYAGWVGQKVIPEYRPENRFCKLISSNNWAAFDNLTPEYLVGVFNEEIVDHPDVAYFSYAADISLLPKTLSRQVRQRAARRGGFTGAHHDGMVSVDSARWGSFLGILPADHASMIGLRVVPWMKDNFDHLHFFDSLLPLLEKVE